MNKIKRVSLFFRVIFQLMFIALPILLIIAWNTSPDAFVMLGGFINMSFIPSTYTATALHPSAILHALTPPEKMLGFYVSSVPTMVSMYIIYSLIKLFKLYEAGIIFSINNVKYIRRIGYALLVGQLINPFYQFAIGIVLTASNPPGRRFAAITIDQTNLGIIFVAGMVILISWIMAEGCALREEQQLTV